MKKLVFYIVILCLLFSCKSQQIAFGSICGTFEGTETFYSVEFKLNKDKTCYLIHTFDLSKIECLGDWTILHRNTIVIHFNSNPLFNDIQKALQVGS